MNASDKNRLNQVGVPDRSGAGKLGDSTRGVGDMIDDAISKVSAITPGGAGTLTVTGDLTVSDTVTTGAGGILFTDSNVKIVETGTNDLSITADNAVRGKFTSLGLEVTGEFTATDDIANDGWLLFNDGSSQGQSMNLTGSGHSGNAVLTVTPAALSSYSLYLRDSSQNGRVVVDVDGALGVGGGLGFINLQTKTANYTATKADALILCDVATTGAFTVTLPAAAALAGQLLIIKVAVGHATNVLTVSRAGSDTITTMSAAAQTSFDSTAGTTELNSFQLVSDGVSVWHVISAS